MINEPVSIAPRPMPLAPPSPLPPRPQPQASWTASLGKLRSHRRQTVDAKVNAVRRLAAVATKTSSRELANWRCPTSYPSVAVGRQATLCLLALCGLLTGCTDSSSSSTAPNAGIPPKPAASPVVLRDVTADKHLKHYYDNGESAGEYSILETIGGGAAVADFDRDGYDDLYLTSGGQLKNKQVTGLGGAMWWNRRGQEFLDTTSLSRTACSEIYSHAAISGDLNNDGFADMLITGYHAAALFINQGDGTFVETAHAAGMDKPSWGTSAAMGDFDADGDLDIYVAHYVDWSFDNHPDCKSLGKKDVCAPGGFTGITDAIYLNNGDGTLSLKQQDIGLVEQGKGLGVMVMDVDQDSKVDIYVANDTTNNFLYLNKDGRFEESGMACGVAVDDMGTPEGSMGLCCLDYDQDLLPDILVCNYENQAFALYKNDGDANFRYVTTTAGLMALGKTYVAWGTVANDFDLDGDEDVIIANGHVMRSEPPEQSPIYLENQSSKKFLSQTFDSASYFSKKWRGRGVAAFDLERDGDMDLLFTHVDQDAVLLENQSQLPGNWWLLELVGTVSNRDAIGTRLVITSNKRKMLRNVVSGGSYLTQKPYYVHWGLPADETLEQVEITWPDGKQEVLKDLSPKARHLIVQPH